MLARHQQPFDPLATLALVTANPPEDFQRPAEPGGDPGLAGRERPGLAVLLGSLAGISITGLLVGGIVPGLILAALFIGYVILRCWLNPDLAPTDEDSGPPIAHPWLNLAVTVVPLIGIFTLVVVSMSGDEVTPTESSALGALATVLVALLYRQLTWESLQKSLMGTASISGAR